ncbi:HAMP domain-containing sensor histidine kinase [Desulfovibrio sp. JC022]|uniref:sensor histidine kinase n=1 Tax=Desulfovibrio sp. JC022 TaxID=2593642 RepID=UPI0013CF8E87|nr:HAMP domain-containing sensor histidine kinase [Desulfovibrio sp. JC022]NDV22082.1 HAMP domain-containing histidine kinase [Desulfovibrio sp. JC022]
MCSLTKKTKKLFSSYRIISAYFLLFVCSTLCLFAMSTFMLDYQLTQMERERISERVSTYNKTYDTKGLESLLRTIRSQHKANTFSNIFIHLTDANGKTVWLTIPQELDELEWTPLQLKAIPNQPGWHPLDLPTMNDLDILVTPLKTGYTLHIGRTTDRQEFMVEGLQSVFIIVLGGVIILGIIGGIMFSRHVLRPVRELAATAKNVSSGDMKSRVPVFEKSGEIRELTELFNLMMERIEILITAMRDTLGNVSHDLKTPLARMKARIEQTLLSDSSAEEQREVLMDCAEDIERIDKLINMLMDITEAETGQMHLSPEPLSCMALIEETLDLYEIIAEDRNIHITNHANNYMISADRQRTLQVIGNLTDNALKYTPEGGKIIFKTRLENNFTIISIQDNGPGIPEEERDRIFEKLYREDKSRSTKGVGLGLSLVRAVMQAHGGSVTVHDAPEGGSLFEIRFPRN